MTFEECFNSILLSSKNPLTVSKYKEDFRDYYKEVIQEKLLHYHGGQYRHPEFQLMVFEEEAKYCAEHAVEYLMKGLYE
tara:strand:- start:257 stop:493 length:237 start_codon:yes stop_codon:yes gene_type:complete